MPDADAHIPALSLDSLSFSAFQSNKHDLRISYHCPLCISTRATKINQIISTNVCNVTLYTTHVVRTGTVQENLYAKLNNFDVHIHIMSI